MKKKITLILIFITLSNSYFSQVSTPTLNFGITSHNEPAENYTTAANFNQTRHTLRKIVDLVFAKGAKYNMQLNPNFVQGSLIHESAATATTDILQYAYNIGGIPANVVQIDPRYKSPSPYNIADVSYSINLTGAQASNVVGGFIYYNGTVTPSQSYSAGDWTPYTTVIAAQSVPTFTWKANVIWGAGSLPPHDNDAINYGVWKPRSKNDSIDFYCHDPAQTVWLQGNGCSWVLTPTTNVNAMIADIRNEATKIKNGTYPANKFYNATLMINFKDFGTSTVTPTFQMPATLSRVLDSINVMKSQGKINWKTIDQKQTAFAAWSGSTSITHSQWRCGQTTTLAPTCAPTGITDNKFIMDHYLSMMPNPATNELIVSWAGQINDKTVLYIFDNLGKKVFEEKISLSLVQVNTQKFNSGIYTLVVVNDSGQSKPQKLIICK
jgi:hypothetical protein